MANGQSLDFYLALTAESQGGVYRVALSRAGETDAFAAACVSDFDAADVELRCDEALSGHSKPPVSDTQLVLAGRTLAACLLPPEIREKLAACLLLSDTATAPVRLRLAIEPPELRRLPWEYAYLDRGPISREHADFLCLHSRFHLIRHTGTVTPISPVIDRPLRLLLAWADPGSPGYPRLHALREEVNAVKAVASGVQVECYVLDNATRSNLQSKLDELRPHLLHFLGHGDLFASGGALILEGGRPGVEDRVYGEELAEWLAQAGVRLAVLSACRTASLGRSVASALAAKGVPAVVGMQLPMRTATSPHFARAFYSSLFQPCPIDVAVNEARQALRHAGVDWGTPVCYLSSRSEDLFMSSAPAAQPHFYVPYPHDESFLGRERELEDLHRKLQEPGRRRAALAGMGGMGKTQLASEYAHAFQHEYPGGVFWIGASSTQRVRAEYENISHRFDTMEDLSYEGRVQRTLTEFQKLERPALLIYDNVTSDTDLKLIPTRGSNRILITTRQEFLVRHLYRTLSLEALTEAAALTLLQSGREIAGEMELAAARDIARLVGYLPLALRLVTHHVRRLDSGFRDYLIRLRAHPVDVLRRARKNFVTTTGHDGSLFDTLDIAYEGLSEAARAVLLTASCFASRGISTEVLARACGLESRDDFDEALADLEDSSLVRREESHRLSVHELVQVFARQLLDPARWRSLLERVAEELTADLAEKSLSGQTGWNELAHYSAVMDLCRDGELMHLCGALLFQIGDLFFENCQGDIQMARHYFEEGLEISEKLVGRRHPDALRFLAKLGVIKQALHIEAEALADAREAVEIAESVYASDSPELGECYNHLGFVLKRQKKIEEALRYYTQAMGIFVSAYGVRHRNVAECYLNMGMLLIDQGDNEKALLNLHEGLAISITVYDARHITVAMGHNSIGQALAKQEMWSEALNHHLQALDIARSGGNPRRAVLGTSHYYIAECQCRLGRFGEALPHYQKALNCYEQAYGPDDRRCRVVRSRIEDLLSD